MIYQSRERADAEEPFLLSPGDVHIWLEADEQVSDDQLLEFRKLLSLDEAQRLQSFRSARDQRLYLVAHAQLRLMLSRYAPVSASAWEFKATSFGRPQILLQHPWQKLHFSLSHTYGLVAIAISTVAEVGIDVEALDRPSDLRSIAEDVLTPAESKQIAELPEDAYRDRFLDLWTLKEAYAKAKGLGLSLGFDRLHCDTQARDVSISERGSTDISWRFRRFKPTARHRMALAVHCACGQEIVRWI